MEEFKHLSFASSLCGNCTEVCAVKINLHELLLENRHDSVEEGFSSITEKLAWKAWKISNMHRKILNLASGKMKNKVINKIFTDWTKGRGELYFSEKTFNQLWKEKNNTLK
jgi:L-lactate dehydrogenase complex protein LldF